LLPLQTYGSMEYMYVCMILSCILVTRHNTIRSFLWVCSNQNYMKMKLRAFYIQECILSINSKHFTFPPPI
jgi:hypothetical protein